MRKDLFTTPFWQFENVDDLCVKQFLTRCSKLDIKPSDNFNIFDYGDQGCAISETEKLLLTYANQCLPDCDIEISRGWINMQRPGEALLPHSHGNELVCCLYLDVPDNSGDLMKGSIAVSKDIVIHLRRINSYSSQDTFYITLQRTNQTRLDILSQLISI
jgi:hypothetical protein